MESPDREPPPQTRPLGQRLAARYPQLIEVFRGVEPRVTTIMVVGALMVLLFEKYGRASAFNSLFATDSLVRNAHFGVMSDYYWFTASVVLLGLIPCSSQIPFRSTRPDALGIGFGDRRLGFQIAFGCYFAFMPIVIVASRFESFANFYPLNSQMGSEAISFLSGKGPQDFLSWFIPYEIGYALYFLGWEYFFRGFLTLGLYDKFGFNAVLVSNIPFVLLHSGKPLPEAVGSILGGLVLGVIAIRTRSFWYGFFLHGAIAVSMDLCAIERRFELFRPGS
jgi:membrane protease YdiL (CAAX protease family)